MAWFLAARNCAQISREHGPRMNGVHSGVIDMCVHAPGAITHRENMRMRGGSLMGVDCDKAVAIHREAPSRRPIGSAGSNRGNDQIGWHFHFAGHQDPALHPGIDFENLDALPIHFSAH